jgi:hypothetical protein
VIRRDIETSKEPPWIYVHKGTPGKDLAKKSPLKAKKKNL